MAACILGSAIANAACMQEPQLSEETSHLNSTIVGGNTENGHPAVAFLSTTVMDGTGKNLGASTCSGTLVGPTTVLTAGHCVVAQAPNRFGATTVYFGTTPTAAKAEEVYRAVKATPHPKYQITATSVQFDVAVIELDRPVTVAAPAKVARTFGNLVGQTVTHVGWGNSVSNGRTQKSGAGTKRSVSLPITEQQVDNLKTGNGKSGICGGDSGGPALLSAGGENVVVGVHSFVDDADFCLKNSFSARVDRYMDFLAPFMTSALVDLGGGKPGPNPTPNQGTGGAGGGTCCVNAGCFVCPTKAALNACVGLDIQACFSQCGQDASCLVKCAERLGTATHDPSGCTAAGNGGGGGGGGGNSCSISISCNGGACSCGGGAKAGAACDGSTSGQAGSCDVVCRLCN